jgi:hypothetical protein
VFAFVGLPMALYALRPVLTPTVAASDLHGNSGAKASITVTGTGIRNVTVQCVTNKVIFDDNFTLELNRYALIDEYNVSDVAVGESFSADCGFSWSIWVNGREGLFVFGELTPAVKVLGIPFRIKGDQLSPGVSGATPMGVTSVEVTTPSFSGYRRDATTEVDGSFIVRYSACFAGLRKKKSFT